MTDDRIVDLGTHRRVVRGPLREFAFTVRRIDEAHFPDLLLHGWAEGEPLPHQDLANDLIEAGLRTGQTGAFKGDRACPVAVITINGDGEVRVRVSLEVARNRMDWLRKCAACAVHAVDQLDPGPPADNGPANDIKE